MYSYAGKSSVSHESAISWRTAYGSKVKGSVCPKLKQETSNHRQVAKKENSKSGNISVGWF
jgi:hypothetical protein